MSVARPEAQKCRTTICVIDDSPFVLAMWELIASPTLEVITFFDPEAAIHDADKLAQSDIIIIDYFFEGRIDYTGVDLANEIRRLGIDSVLALSSSAPITDEGSAFDLTIDKNVLDEASLRGLLVAHQAPRRKI